MNIKMHDYIFR